MEYSDCGNYECDHDVNVSSASVAAFNRLLEKVQNLSTDRQPWWRGEDREHEELVPTVRRKDSQGNRIFQSEAALLKKFKNRARVRYPDCPEPNECSR